MLHIIARRALTGYGTFLTKRHSLSYMQQPIEFSSGRLLHLSKYYFPKLGLILISLCGIGQKG